MISIDKVKYIMSKNAKSGNTIGTLAEKTRIAGCSKIHINAVHKVQKDHKCDSCGKAFSQARSLQSKRSQM